MSARTTDNPITAVGPHLVRTVEEAAIACASTIGKGDRHHSDQVAVSAMRRVLDSVPVRGQVVIGEGERDKAPMLWSGEQFGCGGEGAPGLDIAVDPLEGTNLCATGAPGAIAVLAGSERGGLLTAPDVYMEKIMVGPASRDLLGDAIRLEHSPERNVRAIAEAEACETSEITVVVLERPRHRELIAGLRRAGARVRLIGDGDLSAGILSAMPGSGIQAAMGSGGAPEGVIAAAALRCLGGGMLGQLLGAKRSRGAAASGDGGGGRGTRADHDGTRARPKPDLLRRRSDRWPPGRRSRTPPGTDRNPHAADYERSPRTDAHHAPPFRLKSAIPDVARTRSWHGRVVSTSLSVPGASPRSQLLRF